MTEALLARAQACHLTLPLPEPGAQGPFWDLI